MTSCVVGSLGQDAGALLRAAGVAISIDPAVFWLASASVVGLAGHVSMGPVVAVGLFSTVVAMPRLARPLVERRRRRQIASAVPRVLAALARAFHAGMGFEAALGVAIGSELTSPELRRCRDAIAVGRPVVDAVDGWAATSVAPERLLPIALGLATRSGADLARCLDSVGEGLRAEAEFLDRRRVVVAQARTSAFTLAVLPIGFALATSAVTERDLVPSPGVGLLMLAGLALDAVGVVWMQHMIRAVR